MIRKRNFIEERERLRRARIRRFESVKDRWVRFSDDFYGFDNEARVVKRNLPVQNYTIVDGFSTDEKIPCDNCDRLLTNVVTVKGADGREYDVGIDCAATLSGISQSDIEYWNDAFKQSKSIRAKLNKYNKQVGSTDNYFVVEYMDWGETRITTYWKGHDGKYASFIVGNDINSLEDFVKYCPDLAKRTYINPNVKPYSSSKDYNKAPKESGETFEGYVVEYRYEEDRYGGGDAYATLYKNGNEIYEYREHIYKSNPTEEDILQACQKACISAYVRGGSKNETEWKILSDVM